MVTSIHRAGAQAFWAIRLAYLEHLSGQIAKLSPGHPEGGRVLLEINVARDRLAALDAA